MTLRSLFFAQPDWMRRIPLAGRLAAWYCIFCGLVYGLQSDLLYHPSVLTTPQLEARLELLRQQGVDVHLGNGGKTLNLTPSGPIQATALLFHGNAGHALHRVALFPEFAQRGIRLVLVEYPGYGWREGAMSEKQAVEEGLAVYSQIRNESPARRPLMVLAESLGTGIAVQVAAKADVAPDKLVLITPYSSLQSVAQQKVPLVPVSLLLRDTFKSDQYLPAYSGPVSILLAGQDEVLGVETGRDLAKVARERGPTQVTELPTALHNTWRDLATPAIWDALLKI